MHINPTERLYLLAPKGVWVTDDWGGEGNLIVTGAVSAGSYSGGNTDNWNTAYTWVNHAATNVPSNEDDPVYTAASGNIAFKNAANTFTTDQTISGNVSIGGHIYAQSGNLYMGNGKTLVAKNFSGADETWMLPRWTDNKMYTNFGSAGWQIRNNGSANVMFMGSNGAVEVQGTKKLKLSNQISKQTFVGEGNNNDRNDYTLTPVATSFCFIDRIAYKDMDNSSNTMCDTNIYDDGTNYKLYVNSDDGANCSAEVTCIEFL
jgi:hypothetical protein